MKQLNKPYLAFESLKTDLALHQLLGVSHFTFLRKCATIKRELKIMGFPKARFQIRNLACGSDTYWLCYPDLALAYAYRLKRDENQAAIGIDNCNEAIFRENVETFIEHIAAKETDYLYSENCYPIADPASLEFYVYEDERTDFSPSPIYLKKKQEVKAAVGEIENAKGEIFLSAKKISSWLAKHFKLYWSLQLDWNYKAFHQFQGLYLYLQLLAEELEQLPLLKQGIKKELMVNADSFELWLENPAVLKQKNRDFYLKGEAFLSLYQFSQRYAEE